MTWAYTRNMYMPSQCERRRQIGTVFHDFTNRLLYPLQEPPIINGVWTSDTDTEIIYNCIKARMAHDKVCVRNIRHTGYFTYDARPVWQDYVRKIEKSLCLLDCHGETIELCITTREHAVYDDADDAEDVEGEASGIDCMQDCVRGSTLTLPHIADSKYSVFVQNFSARGVLLHGGIALTSGQVVNVNKLCLGMTDNDYLGNADTVVCRDAGGNSFLIVHVQR